MAGPAFEGVPECGMGSAGSCPNPGALLSGAGVVGGALSAALKGAGVDASSVGTSLGLGVAKEGVPGTALLGSMPWGMFEVAPAADAAVGAGIPYGEGAGVPDAE